MQQTQPIKNILHFVNLRKRYVNKILPENVKVEKTYTGKRFKVALKQKIKQSLSINKMLYNR